MKCPRCEHENPADSHFCSNCASPLDPGRKSEDSLTQTFTEPEPKFERGRLFAGRYEFIEGLGSGGMGKVYKVYDTKIREIVALKIIRPEIASRPNTLIRFREEIRLARRIAHKNICRMHDLNEAEGVSFFTMEYIPGEDLKRVLRMMGRLSVGRAISIARQVCAGLAEAHRLGIVHRDLKPKNIMVDYEGNIRVMDFGLARSVEEKGITAGRVILGTAEYMSPEQAEGEKADHRSDIYALGVILFEMVTGRTPFEGDSALSVALQHKTEPPPDPRQFNPALPEKLRQIILKCLEKDKEKRFQTVEELTSELETLEKECPTEERMLRPKRPTISRDIVRSWGLKRIALPAFALLLVLLIIFLIRQSPWKKPAVLAPQAKPSLLVLPFKNNTGDKNLDVWREALAENLIAELRRSSGNLLLLSADTTRTVIKKSGLEQATSFSSEDLKKMMEETGVSHIVVGSYSLSRMYYDLKDTRQNIIIGSGRAEGEGERDFNRMTDELTRQILADLKLPSTTQPPSVLTPSSWANRYYNLGRQAERKYKDSREEMDFATAISYYEKAIAEDPTFPLPHWGLGDSYQSRYVRTKQPEDLERTIRSYEKAYQLAPYLGGPNSGLGWAYFLRGDNDNAFAHFRRSLELEPENPSIHYNIGSFFKSIGLVEKAIQFYTNAIEQGEISFMVYWLRATCSEHIAQYDAAVQDARRLIEMEPDNLRAALFYTRMLISQRNLVAAEREIAVAENLSPASLDLRLTKSLLFASRGEREKALPLLEEAKQKPVYYSLLLSRVYALLDMKEEAVDIIQSGIEKGFAEVQEYLFEYPLLEKTYYFDNLRESPRFRELLAKQKAVHENNMKKYGGL